jgi:outer membrane protein TolC
LSRNRGPIAEAEARREISARRVAEAQDRVLGEVEQGLAGCASAVEQVHSLDITAARDRLSLTEAAYQRGEVGRLEVALARLELARASRRLSEAEAGERTAALALEHEIGAWSRKGGL